MKLDVGIREVLGSNLGHNTGYPDYGSSWSPSIPAGKFRDSILIRSRPLPSNPSQFIMHQSYYYPTLYSLGVEKRR
jgi:hypothetical protein